MLCVVHQILLWYLGKCNNLIINLVLIETTEWWHGASTSKYTKKTAEKNSRWLEEKYIYIYVSTMEREVLGDWRHMDGCTGDTTQVTWLVGTVIADVMFKHYTNDSVPQTGDAEQKIITQHRVVYVYTGSETSTRSSGDTATSTHQAGWLLQSFQYDCSLIYTSVYQYDDIGWPLAGHVIPVQWALFYTTASCTRKCMWFCLIIFKINFNLSSIDVNGIIINFGNKDERIYKIVQCLSALDAFEIWFNMIKHC